jgi:hypothetical protein
MRIDLGGSLIMFFWSDGKYRNEIARLVQGINRPSLKLVRARRFLGCHFVVVRRLQALN